MLSDYVHSCLIFLVLYVLKRHPFQTHFNGTADISLSTILTTNPEWKKKEKDGNFSNILSKAEPMFELAMKPRRSSFLILTLMSHWRAWGEAKLRLGPLAHCDVLFQTEQLLFICQRGSNPQYVSVCLVTKNTRNVFIFLIQFLQKLYRRRFCFLFFLIWTCFSYGLHGNHH